MSDRPWCSSQDHGGDSCRLVRLLATRLWYLQVVRGEQYAAPDGNRIRVVPIRAPRGGIFDRQEGHRKQSLSYTVSVVPLGLPAEARPRVLELLARIIKMPVEEIERILMKRVVHTLMSQCGLSVM